MSKESFEWFDNLEEPEGLSFQFDPNEQLAQDHERLCQWVEEELVTLEEANHLYEQAKELYGL